MTKHSSPVIADVSKLGMAVFIAIQLLTGCSIVPQRVAAKEVLTRALAPSGTTSNAVVKSDEYIASQTDQYQIQAAEPADPYHKKGLRPETIQVKMWQLRSDPRTYRIQHVNPVSSDVMWEATQSVVNGQIYRTVQDARAALEFTTIVPSYDATARNADLVAAESARRTQLLETLGQNATVTMIQSSVVSKPIFRVVSRIPIDFALKNAPIVDEGLLGLLDQKPKEILQTYDIDSDTYEIVGQATTAVMQDGLERTIQSTQLVSRQTAPLSGLPADWFAIKNLTLSANTYGFDIHQEVVDGRAAEDVKALADGRVLSIISGSESKLVQGLQSVAPVWDQSKEITFQLAGAAHQAWLCEGGVLSSDPVRRLLIFTTADKLFYVTGQSFSSSDQFIQTVAEEFGR